MIRVQGILVTAEQLIGLIAKIVCADKGNRDNQ